MTRKFRSIEWIGLTLIVCWLVGAPVWAPADSEAALPKGGCCGSTDAPAASASCACAGQPAHSGCGEGHVRLASGETTSGDGPSGGGIGILQEGGVMCAEGGCAAPGCWLGQCGEFVPPDPPPCGGAATCACNAPAGNCDCGQYCANFMQPCVYMELVAKGTQDADGIETCRCLPNNDATGWPVCGCDEGEEIPNCTPGGAWCFCTVAAMGYCTNEPCGATNCKDYCWETQCPTCGGLSIEIARTTPSREQLYVNLGETTAMVTARVTRNGQPVQGAKVEWLVEDPDEPWGPSYLDPDGGRCNCGDGCPDEGKNGKSNCGCNRRPHPCPARNDDDDPNNAPDNHGPSPSVISEGQTDQNGEADLTLMLRSSYGGDNWDVWAVLCPKPPDHPQGMDAARARFTVWRRIEVERDSMESSHQPPIADFYQAAYNRLAGAFDDGYIELHLLPDTGGPGDDPDCDDDCAYVQLLRPEEASFANYADTYFAHPGHRVQYLGVNEIGFLLGDGVRGVARDWGSDQIMVAAGELGVDLENAVGIHENGHAIGAFDEAPSVNHADDCIMEVEEPPSTYDFCAQCVQTLRSAPAYE